MGRAVTKWTPDRLDMLRRLVAEGLTTREIARRMDVTLNSAGQQIYRLGLQLWGRKKRLDMAHLKNRFYAARKAAGMTRQEAAERSGISEHMIGQYERGMEKPARMVLWKSLAQTYGCSIGDLLGEEVLDTTQK